MEDIAAVENFVKQARRHPGSLPIRDIVLGAYFTSKLDPQRPGLSYRSPVGDYTYFWRLTSNALGLPVVIFTDAADEEANRLEGALCQVVSCKPGELSVNDERFLAMESYLKASNHERVLLTDTGDVLLKSNPFKFMSDQSRLYFGSDKSIPIRKSSYMVHRIALLNSRLPLGRRFLQASPFLGLLSDPKFPFSKGLIMRLARRLAPIWCRMRAERKQETIWNYVFVNVGVVGGSREAVLRLLERTNDLFREAGEGGVEVNLDMAVFNYVLWRDNDSVFSGPPFTNRFKSYNLSGPEYLFHK